MRLFALNLWVLFQKDNISTTDEYDKDKKYVFLGVIKYIYAFQKER